MKYADLAVEVMRLYADLPEADLRGIVRRSYAAFDDPDITPLKSLGALHVLELFHGPTLAFKDLALQFLGNLFEYYLRQSGGDLNLVAATSGDTGSAAICGVRGKERMRIFVMHPQHRISRMQELQMTSVLDANVHNLAIEGTFDDCQGILKSLFNDLAFRDRCALGSVNSINWARVLAQLVYYFYGAFRAMERTGCQSVAFAVPTGNFGDIFAGYLAARMGLPVARLILATNENDILARFFNTGVYARGPVTATISPSMDIQVASNFERYLYYRLGESGAEVRRAMEAFAARGALTVPAAPGQPVDRLFAAGAGDTASTLATIRWLYEEHGYLADPHTAVGVHVARTRADPAAPVVCLATAHPAKFAEAVRDALGRDLARHPALEALQGRPTRVQVLPAAAEAVRHYIEAQL
jgi:threonine synthase